MGLPRTLGRADLCGDVPTSQARDRTSQAVVEARWACRSARTLRLVDLLGELMRTSGVRGAVGVRVEAGGTWGVRLHEFPGAALHAVTQGTAWLALPRAAPRVLGPGDVVLLPPGTEHRLTSGPHSFAGSCDRAAAARARQGGGVVRLGAGEVDTRVLTVHYEQDPASRTLILANLPEVLHLPTGSVGSNLTDVVRILGRELEQRGAAASLVLDRMTDVLLVEVLRAWLERPANTLWLCGLADPMIAAALRGIHQDPGRAWTNSELALMSGVSRATLARRFPAATGLAPAAYLLRWRMELAAVRLRESDDSLHAIARSVGYASVHALSRAFARERGEPPGRYRARHRCSGEALALVQPA